MANGTDPKTHAAIVRISGKLGPHLTLEFVEELRRSLKVRKVRTANGSAGLLGLLAQLAEDGRRRSALERAIINAVAEGYRRTQHGETSLTGADVEAVRAEMRGLRLPIGALRSYRSKIGASVAPTTIDTWSSTHHRSEPRTYPIAVEAITKMLNWPPSRASERGSMFEGIVDEILRHERLDARWSVNVPGQQVDFTFRLDGTNYLMECAWEAHRIGLPKLHEILSKVAMRPASDFGVFLSMSSFTADVNTHLAPALRNALGIGPAHLMAVIGGHTTFATTIRAARRALTDRLLFYASD